jgi:aminomethyltransferase
VTRPSELRRTPFDFAYPADLETEWIDVMGYAVPLWISDPETEYQAFRSSVGLLEYSMLYRWEINGPRAIEVANRVHTRDIAAMHPGEICYGVIVDEQGFMIDDPTVSVYSNDRVLIVGGNPAVGDVIRRELDSDTQLAERREEFCVLSVQGPNSRKVLQSLTDADLSNEAFPYYSFQPDISLAGIAVQINRIGFTAELGFEVVASVEDAATLFDAVHAAAVVGGVAICGAAALMMCRIESGMVMAEVEYDHSLTPFECRLGWAVDFSKSEFIGRGALIAAKESAEGRVMTIRIEGDAEGLDGAPIESAGRTVGAVTMAVPSPALGGATLAMARLHRDVAVVGQSLTISTNGGTREAEVLRTPVYDPERVRVKS